MISTISKPSTTLTGTLRGDEILRAVAQKIATVVRGMGEAFRCGDEEISVILPNHSLVEANAVPERIRTEITFVRIASLPDCSVTASLGVATIPDTSEPVEAITADADRAMYEAKNSGRNRVTSAAKENSGARVQPNAKTRCLVRVESLISALYKLFRCVS